MNVRTKFHSLRGCLAFLIVATSVDLHAGVVGSARDLNTSPGGRIVWWGSGPVLPFWKNYDPQHTNGVIEVDDEVLTNAASLAAVPGFAGLGTGFAVRSDGSVAALSFGGKELDLTNVMSVAVEGNSCWAIRHDGTVAKWGNEEEAAEIRGGLSNITAIAWAGYRSYVALKSDGTMLGFHFDQLEVDPVTGEPVRSASVTAIPVKVNGQILSNVAAVVSMDSAPLILQRDGVVRRLGGKRASANRGLPDEGPPYDYRSVEPVLVGGSILSNIVTLASAGGHLLALRDNGTVVGAPGGLSNATAISVGQYQNLALRRDGTVVAWRGAGQGAVPTGLSNVVAIAAGAMFSLAITTGDIPASVYVRPHGRVETLEREVDLVFKGRVISTRAETNVAFPDWGEPHVTEFEIVSMLKGRTVSNLVIFHHLTGQPNQWGGGTPPSSFSFENGRSYLVFAVQASKADWLYSPASNHVANPNEFRQPMRGDFVLRTLDARPLAGLTPKEAHWAELNLLLTDGNASNQLYAIQHLNAMSKSCLGAFGHTDDFKRPAVLEAVWPFVTNHNEEVAMSAIGCFQVGGYSGTFLVDQGVWMPILHGSPDAEPRCVAQVAPYADKLVAVADGSPSVRCRVAAVAAFSCTGFPVVKSALPKWLNDSAEEFRVQAVLLLPDFEGEFSLQALRTMAADTSPKVRAAVAEAIGNGKMEILLPILMNLFSAPVGPTNPVPPLSLEELQAGGRLVQQNVGDVHTSAGDALLKFDTDQVSSFLKANLSDLGFRISFLCKLAEKDAGPWLSEMAGVLEGKRAMHEAKATAFGWDLKTFRPSLSGTYFRCWYVLYDHLHELPSGEFQGGKLDRCLEALENAGDTGSQEPTKLYELYRLKGLQTRAAEFRSKCEASYPFDIRSSFNRVDKELTNRQVNPDR